jgi:5-formyltetrahydrofolate cyclo-ligase
MPAIDGNHLRMCELKEIETIHRNPITKIFEPVIKKWIDESEITLVIVPGRGFTIHGDRLGRGNGGYDYWIAAQRKRNPSTNIIGICFDCQILTEIPMETHDEKVDQVISATKTASSK